jgi:hypothetical protein
MDEELHLEEEEELPELSFPYNIYIQGKLKRYADHSLFLLPTDNRFRLVFMWINEWVWFDRIVLFLIVSNSILLATNDYSFR